MKDLVLNGLNLGRLDGLDPVVMAAACSAVAAESSTGGGVLL